MSSLLSRLKKIARPHRNEVPAPGVDEGAMGADIAGGRVRSYVDVRQSAMSMRTYKWVLIAVAFLAFYYVVFASERYATEGQVYVRAAEGSAAGFPAPGFLNIASPDKQDAYLVRDYILSADMLNLLDAEVALRDHYTDPSWDFFSRLSADATYEEFLLFYRDHLRVEMDVETSIITVEAQGFTEDYALNLSRQIIKNAEIFINRISQEIAEKETGFARGEVLRARMELIEAQNRLEAFQRENNLLDAEASNLALQEVLNKLNSEISGARVEERRLTAFLNDEAAELVTLRDQITALEAQRAQELTRLDVADTNGTTINEQGLEASRLKLELKLATDLYSNALAGLEQARVDAYRQLKHLIVVQSPHLAGEYAYPRVIYNLLTVFVLLTLLYGIGSIILATIREHRDV